MRDPIRLDAALAKLELEPSKATQPKSTVVLPALPGPVQQELFSVETRWFPVLRALVESGVMARIGPMGIAAYVGLKANAELGSGRAKVSVALIASQTGMSLRAAQIALRHLEAEGLVNVRSQPGCQNVYQFVERIPFVDSTGELAGEVAWNFSSDRWKEQLKTIAEFVRNLAKDASGARPSQSTTINVGTMNINIHIGPAQREEQS